MRVFAHESFCAVQLALQFVCRTLGSKRSELLRCSARFSRLPAVLSPFSLSCSENAWANYEVRVQVVAELPAPAADVQQRQAPVEHRSFSVTVVLSTFAPEWFTQALSSLQSQLAETRSAASEAVAATEMLSTDVR